MAFRSVTERVAQALTMTQVEAEFRLPLAVGPVLADIGQAARSAAPTATTTRSRPFERRNATMCSRSGPITSTGS